MDATDAELVVDLAEPGDETDRIARNALADVLDLLAGDVPGGLRHRVRRGRGRLLVDRPGRDRRRRPARQPLLRRRRRRARRQRLLLLRRRPGLLRPGVDGRAGRGVRPVHDRRDHGPRDGARRAGPRRPRRPLDRHRDPGGVLRRGVDAVGGAGQLASTSSSARPSWTGTCSATSTSATRPGSDPDDPSAHGSLFDQLSAFQEGYADGPQACAAFDEDRLYTLEPFDRGRGGDGRRPVLRGGGRAPPRRCSTRSGTRPRPPASPTPRRWARGRRCREVEEGSGVRFGVHRRGPGARRASTARTTAPSASTPTACSSPRTTRSATTRWTRCSRCPTPWRCAPSSGCRPRDRRPWTAPCAPTGWVARELLRGDVERRAGRDLARGRRRGGRRLLRYGEGDNVLPGSDVIGLRARRRLPAGLHRRHLRPLTAVSRGRGTPRPPGPAPRPR